MVWGLTQKAVRRKASVSVPDLVHAIKTFPADWNENPRPFVYTAKLEDVLRKITLTRAKLESLQPACTQPREGRNEINDQYSYLRDKTSGTYLPHCPELLPVADSTVKVAVAVWCV